MPSDRVHKNPYKTSKHLLLTTIRLMVNLACVFTEKVCNKSLTKCSVWLPKILWSSIIFLLVNTQFGQPVLHQKSK